MLKVPQHSNLPVDRLSAVFDNTTNAYKFYWFLAILDEIKETGRTEIDIEDLCKRMVSSVWYPLDFFKLSFGKSDGFKTIADTIRKHLNIDNSINAPSVLEQVEKINNLYASKVIDVEIKKMERWVPYRFIRPFFAEQTHGLSDTVVNAAIKDLAGKSNANADRRSIYHFTDRSIVVDDLWMLYLQEHQAILRAYTSWHLLRFVQKNNPNVIGISEKLFKPAQRNLKKYIESWKAFISLKGGVDCIYSKARINKDFSLDHFIPWSYTVNDLSWNLVPVSKSVNSSKADCLPSGIYIGPLASLQHSYFHTLTNSLKFNDVLEDYVLLFNNDVREIKQMDYLAFEDKFRETLSPMMQIAANMGFRPNWNISPVE